VELIERLVLSMTHEGDWVFDPFLGVGTTIVAAILHSRRGAGAEIVSEYVRTAKQRIHMAAQGVLRIRPRTRPIYDPKDAGNSLTTPPWAQEPGKDRQMFLIKERKHRYGT
jgi:adenine-specific DNA-methyltransferase